MILTEQNDYLILEAWSFPEQEESNNKEQKQGIIIPKSAQSQNRENLILAKTVYDNRVVLCPRDALYYITIKNKEYMAIPKNRVVAILDLSNG